MNSAASASKESEIIASVKEAKVEEISKDAELKKDVADAGVEKIHGVIELPPDVKKLGVTLSGSQAPVVSTTTPVSLPISDDKIFKGTNAPITSALKWLAVWCLKRLKSAHLILKLIHGKIIRVKVK